MSDIPAIRRQLKIQAGGVARLAKENGLYRKEADQLKLKRDKLVVEDAESWDVKNATRMIEESEKMVIDTATRLGKAADVLSDLVVLAEKESELAEDPALVKAKEALEAAKA
ncbi:uncharacterized protein LACBIDRAFT_192425 [Laccaria bicolor S238N-H82]|uniref:Tubulin-specific chaperone A n=1 Tax=Laccaria bicolor (strain S238N-H82 / ATCC MYA-4686) TaxID=486041 RepID=B0CRQ2_LACBS|nr:uncharacterized protein LACBIDRAFT_192425 [Laccaria bicolor S238N-H82]EDR15238.1 predicted protein [Laccaria bicolor S238N-H82]|eukprot:XP_001873446.1 predicted protein [Laccaria bicolor S238N-H82]